MPAMAADLVRRPVAVIVATGGVVLVVRRQGGDRDHSHPVRRARRSGQLGLVVSLANRAASAGVNFLSAELGGKQLEGVHELVPKGPLALRVLQSERSRCRSPNQRDAGRCGAMGLRLQVFNVGKSRDINTAFAALARERPDALFVIADPVFRARRIHWSTGGASRAARDLFVTREYINSGGLISYGSSSASRFVRAASTPAAS